MSHASIETSRSGGGREDAGNVKPENLPFRYGVKQTAYGVKSLMRREITCFWRKYIGFPLENQ
ncbi:hypothetical protein [Bacillus marinisedimentorum]|uniref:hypothetical protein n=1 Tax=Bacillus marinisedimentorum TaxID=1821260 RepID=UPI0007E07871|nr:hypothetical protein [Bacillus marinisedimentorum]